ncbi:SusE domain-containing protein [Aridibaculum aurantiacum]|uniref:SusE domain-containing protein n=1 Tax=Aridibaculum aurantiacum TaxID=2810307 RepID=UPI001A96D699|nr:SusE domain-containing protein [Aridibaculum aurantiacum]
MKTLFKLLSFTLVVVLSIAGCRKIADLPYYGKGTPVTLTASRTTVAPTPADSNTAVVSFSWTSPNYATDSNNYKYVVEIDSAGRDFSRKVTKEVTGQRSTSFTGRELNAILLGYGFQLGTPYNMDVRVVSSYKNNNEQYMSNVVRLTVTPFTDSSTLTSTATTVTGTLASSSQNALTFNWTPSFVGYTGMITYSIQYDSVGKNFASPNELAAGANTYSLALTQGQINETALTEGVAGGTTGRLEYRVKATTAQGAVAFSNRVAITVNTYVPLLRLYMPGGYQAATGNGTDWEPGNAPEFIRDLRSGLLNKMYYTYIYLPAGAEFKITEGRSWSTNYGGTNGNLSAGGANLSVQNAGVYRISVDLANMKYDIREGRMGIVGDVNGWSPASAVTTHSLGYAGRNLFVGVFDLPAGGWKMIDNNEWNNGSNTVTETRSYGAAGGTGTTMEVNGSNFPNIPAAGRYRVIWDGRDPDNIKYELMLAPEMRLVGDGINMAGVNDWDPASSPAMQFSGNGIWTLTVGLKANKDIKFLSGNAWGAFDYEDAGPGAAANTRRIRWEGGDNFKTPATAGTYTITLNERTQTMTIQ